MVDGLELGLALTAYGFGFRHGIDWDHIAAITDITGAEPDPRRAFGLATVYAGGHAAMVFALGLGAIALAQRLPAGVDRAMERFVGVTLLALGLYVVVALVRDRDGFRMQSRWMLLFTAVGRCARWLTNPSSAPERERRHGSDNRARTALLVGVVHGVGAETPTQLLIFLAAAGAGGTPAGVVLLLLFIAGLVTSNSLIALAATLGFSRASRARGLYLGVSAVTASFSLFVGTVFVLGRAAALPAFVGG
jgi:high-affinity nickel-transport protein